jgi:long-chain acyl-CoA synthetase
VGTQDNVAGLVAAAAARRPEAAAVTGPGGVLTWRELAAGVRGLAGWLSGAGLEPGDRVGLLLGNRAEFPLAYFAVLWAGLVAVPMNTGYTRAELDHQLRDSGARLLVTTAALADTGADLLAAVPGLERVLVVGEDAWTTAVAAEEQSPNASTGPSGGGEDLAVLLYTSGTSGRPKGAMLSHRALLANLEQIARLDPVPVLAEDAVLVVIPLFHIYGLNAGLGMVARQGATAVLVDRFEPVETMAAVTEYGVTAIVGAPPVYLAWSMLPDLAPLRTVRLLLSGAAPLAPEVRERMKALAGVVVHEGYGLTETAPVLTTTLGGGGVKPASVGRPVPGVQLRLLTEGGEPVEEDDPGEISVRGPNLFSGYWPDGADGPDADGWFATGDVAYADADGDLFLVDRVRELILVSGFNVYPREVEDVLEASPDVLEAAVIGRPHPYTGESVTALVVPRPGRTPSADQLIEHCARSLARFKCPTSVVLVAELPHSATGKVSKGRIRAGELGAAAVTLQR